MRPAHSLAAILLLSAFAGCLGGSGDTPPVDTAAAEAEAMPIENVTNDDGTTEMAPDVGQMPHIHDYWMDRERVTIMDEDVTVDAAGALSYTFFSAFRGVPGVGGKQLVLPEGAVVYQGTGKLEFTVTWSEATVTGMGVSYRTPAETTYSKAEEVKSNAPLIIEVTPEMTDMPHSKTSRWQFLLMPAQPGQSMVGKFRVKIDILRMGDITLFPGHPELFGGANTLELFKGAGSSNQNNVVTEIATRVQGQNPDDGVRSAKVVPMETQSMTANLTIKAADSNIGKTGRVLLLVKSADRSFYSQLDPIAKDAEAQTYQFAWLVQMTMTDSPYATESDWKFDVQVYADSGTPAPGTERVTTGLSNIKVEYDLEVIAYDDVVPDAKELQFRGRGG